MSKRGVQILDFDLNLAPIIDCFVVLITFMRFFRSPSLMRGLRR